MALVARHKWITQGGDIGTVPELEFIDIPLETTNPTNDLITFEVISGELPPGIQVVRSPGSIQGVPVVLDPIEVDEARKYQFSIRAKATNGNVVTDRSFSLTVTNLFPPYIIPRITNLGTVFDGSYYTKQLRATEPNPNAKLVWKIQSGQLPPGISMSENGLISGYVAIESADADNVLPGYDANSDSGSVTYYDAAGWDTLGRSRNRKYTFTAQVSDGNSIDTLTYNLGVAAKGLFTTDQDHTTIAGFDEQPIGISCDNDELSVDADNRYVPIITTPTQELPFVRQENYFAFKFDAIDFEGDDIEFQFRLADGSGFGQAGTDVYGWKDERNGRGTQFDPLLGRALNNPKTRIFFPTDGQTLNFNLDVSPYPEGSQFDINPDGADGTHNNFTSTTDGYVVYYEDASGNVTILEEGVDFNVNVTETEIQVTDPALVPSGGRLAVDVAILLPGNTTPTGSGFDTGLFDQAESKLPPVLSIDSNGWLNGYVEPQIEDVKVYDFIIAANKVDDPSYVSAPIQYSLTILGSLTDVITWVTPTDLGSVVPGEVSQLKIEAVSARGQNILYELKTSSTINLPQGLDLNVLGDGLISGRTSFRSYQMDSGLTTFDKNRTLFDNVHELTVIATTADGLTRSEKSFTLRVNPLYRRPYENLYLKSLPTREQRQTFLDIVNNQEIFPDELIYRKNDPWFGRAKTIKFLALAGIEPSTLETYVNAMQNNHYNKQIELGEIKTARAVDEFYNVIYEVVYLQVNDPKNRSNAQVEESVKLGAVAAPQGGQFFLDQTPSNIQSFIDQDGNVITPWIYPNTFENMNKRIIDNLGYSARGVFPQWMLDVQEDKRVLGFQRAVVLAYTVPGASKLIAYRLRSNNIRFGNIDFEVDRYQLDNVLTKNFEIANNRFTPSEETTFDRLIIGVGGAEIPVTYAVEQSFESINLRTRDYINNNQLANPLVGPGIDGVKNFKHGETLVFARQEGFSNVTDETDGWLQYQNTYLGDIPLDGDANELATAGGKRVGSTLSGGNSIWEFSNGTVSIQASGLPYHSTGNPQAANVPQAQNYRMTWPNYAGRNYPNPTPTATPPGPIGFWINGVAMFNPGAAGGVPFGYQPVAGHEFNAAYEAGATLNYSFGEDDAGGHAAEQGRYHYHDYHFASSWASGIGATDGTAGASDLDIIPYYNNTWTHTDGHSKILGWSLDGYPVYGPIGYSNPIDATSAPTRMVTSWALKQNYDHRLGVANDPVSYPLGIFIEDFEHIQGAGTLDKHNGRYCVTPDYPNGTYAYFVTVDANNDPVYPYVIGPEYYGHAQPFGINSNSNGFGLAPSGTDLLAAIFTSDYDGIYGYDSYKIIPGFREKSLTVFKTLLVQTSVSGSDTFDIPYQFGADFVGDSLQGTTGFTSQTKIIQQSTVDISQTPGVVNLVTRLVTNLPTTVKLTAGTEVQVINAMESDEIGIGDTIGIATIPDDLKVGMLIQGNNIPDNTYIYSIDIVNSRIAVTNSVSGVLSGTVIRYLQTNQRGGVWRINVLGSQKIVNFTHVADYAVSVPFSELQGQAWSAFLSSHPKGIDGIKDIRALNGKRIVFMGPISRDRDVDWQTDEVFDLLQYDPLITLDQTRPVPTHHRRQIWQLDFIETDNVISVKIEPSELMDSDTFDEDLGFEQVVLNKEYILRLTLVDTTVAPESRVRIRLGSFKDKDLQLAYDESWAIKEPIESDEVISLEFVREVEIGQKVKVGKGNSWGFTFLTYDATFDIDQTVPRYKYWENAVEAEAGSEDKDYTRFDGGGTRFFDYRDSYHDPESGDKYLKFPQIGVFI
jgi:hypothetical protein